MPFAEHDDRGTCRGTPFLRHRAGVAAWPAVFLALTVLRLLLGFVPTDTMLVHERIVASLLAGHNWGRQALVGSVEFPPLPTLGLLLARVVAVPLRLSPGALMVAAAQVWTVLCLIRMPRDTRTAWGLLAGAGLLFLAPDMQNAVLTLDPNWVAAIPLSSAVLHMVRWYRERALRDAVLVAIHCGVLGLAGLVGVAFSVAALAMMCHDLHRVSTVAPPEQGGIKFLLWTPLAYGVALWLLWNWLIMGDFLFSLRRVWHAVVSSTVVDWTAGFALSLEQTSLIMLGGGVVLMLCVGTGAHGLATCLLSALFGVLCCRSVLESLSVTAAGGGLLVLLLGAASLLLPLPLLLEHGRPRRFALAAALVATSVLGGMARTASSPVEDQSFMLPAPEANAVTALVDRFWPDSRIAVYGLHAPAIYHDPAEKRFLARLDFQPELFLEQAQDEQLYMLIPPCNGLFYARRAGPLADVHRKGRPYLLLEKRWPDGWQLWRCVLAPSGESPLDALQ